jgi:hypothetical protein
MRNSHHVRILEMQAQRDRNINFLIQRVGLVKKVVPIYSAQIEFYRDNTKRIYYFH